DLHSDADSEHGTAARDPPLDQLAAAHGIELLHHRAEGAHAGHEQTVSVGDQAPVARQAGVRAGGLERLDGGMDVARAVLEHGDDGGIRHQRAPLVDGMPSTAASRAFAWRNARASALNSASAMWCGSRPASTSTCTVRPAWNASASKAW